MDPKPPAGVAIDIGSVSAKSAVVFLRSFFGASVVMLAALLMLRMVALPSDILDDASRRGIIDALPSDEIAALKVRQAEQHARYDIGLFGNSRILMICTDELHLGDRSVYNFAVPGQSVRQSIRLLDQLSSRHKTPRTAVISMDYIELGLPGGSGIYPSVPTRWLNELADAWIAWQRQGPNAAAVALINAADLEGQEMALTFNHLYLVTKLRALAGNTDAPAAYRGDGSRKEVIPTPPPTLGRMPQRGDSYPEIESDFARLAAIRDSGTRVIVYESPVAPQFSGTEDHLSANARTVRQRFHDACARFLLKCMGPPALTAQAWFDRDHAPAALLAAWLRPLIEQKN
jgi:hypothetical protein